MSVDTPDRCSAFPLSDWLSRPFHCPEVSMSWVAVTEPRPVTPMEGHPQAVPALRFRHSHPHTLSSSGRRCYSVKSQLSSQLCRHVRGNAFWVYARLKVMATQCVVWLKRLTYWLCPQSSLTGKWVSWISQWFWCRLSFFGVKWKF